MHYELELLQQIKGCCKSGEFTLSSNQTSGFYIDVKQLFFNPETLETIIIKLFVLMVSKFGRPQSIGGSGLGSTILTTGMVLGGQDKNRPLSHFVVRKNRKDHGTKNQIEGLCEGNIVLVDDVLTTGKTLKEAAKVVTDNGGNVLGAVVVVDREECKIMPFPVFSLFTKSEIMK